MTDKTIPNSPEAETALLGSLFIDPQAYSKVAGMVEARHFYLQKHRWIFAAIKGLRENGEPTDLITMMHELDRRGQLEAVGGALYLSQLAGCVPSAMNIASYARIVTDTHRRREVLDLTGDIAKIAFNEAEDMGAVAGYIQERVADLFATSEKQRVWPPFAELAPHLPKVTWLWPAWIPLGMITLLGATSGAGKSMIALDLCKRVMHGLPFPNAAVPTTPGNVLYVDAEYIPETIKERMEWWRMDFEKFFIMHPRPNDMIDLTRPEYREQLRAMVASIQPRMVIVDSLSSITTKGENAIEDVRSIMGFLNEIANTYKTAMVIIHHIRKKGQAYLSPEVSKDDFRGSGHITAMARSVIGLSVIQTGADADPNGPRKLAVLKANLCASPAPIGCEFLPMHPEGVLIEWQATAPEGYKAPTKLEECTRFLEALLKDTGEPVSPKEIIGMAREEGYSRDLVFQARKALGQRVQNTGGYKDPANQWEWVD